MEGRKTLKLTNQNQFETLVELMEKNEQLARGFLKGIQKADIKKEWASIAEQLNSKGPPIRDGDGWQKVWADMKFNVKKKTIHNSKEISATGGGPNRLKILTPLEEAVANLLNFKKLVNPSGNAFGTSHSRLLSTPASVPSSSQIQASDTSLQDLTNIMLNQEDSFVDFEVEVSENQHQEQQNENIEPAGRKRRHATAFKNERAELLRKQSLLQDTTLNGINNSLKNIEGSMKDIERYIRKSYKLKEETAKRDEKRLKIQEEKFLLYKRELERKEIQRKETNKIKIMDLEIKRKQIEIEEKKLALKK